jgi:hypothetical protein
MLLCKYLPLFLYVLTQTILKVNEGIKQCPGTHYWRFRSLPDIRATRVKIYGGHFRIAELIHVINIINISVCIIQKLKRSLIVYSACSYEVIDVRVEGPLLLYTP